MKGSAPQGPGGDRALDGFGPSGVVASKATPRLRPVCVILAPVNNPGQPVPNG